MKYGCCTGIDRYNDLVDLDYDFIELAGTDIYSMSDSEFEHAKVIIKNGPIGCPRVNAFLSPDVRVIGDNLDQEKITEYVDKVLYRSGMLGVETIGFGSPKSRDIPQGFSREKAIMQAVDFVKFVTDKSEKYGIKILVEAVCGKFTNFINTIDEAMSIVKQVNNDYAALIIDLYHFGVEKEDISIINEEIVKYLKHVHIADEQSRAFPAESGMDKYCMYINRLKQLGYDETISIEADCIDFKAEAEAAIKILRQIG